MIDDSRNESNLMQQREDRRTLAKMRRKLATSGTIPKKSDLSHQAHQAHQAHQVNKRSLRIWPFAAGAAILLLALNFGLGTKYVQNALGANGPPANTLALPPGLALDDQARFWTYAVYDVPKLKSRFSIPKGMPIDIKAARKQLEQILAENLGPDVRNEIFIFQQKDLSPKTPAARSNPLPKPIPSINAR
ncbi:MAG: hypothetical protein ABIW76_05790 [Fibrobacteria bacterium]